jgi:hypothetical protein
VSATLLLAGGLWIADELTATNPTASATPSVTSPGSSTQRGTTTTDDSSSSGSRTSFTPSVSQADTSSHAT